MTPKQISNLRSKNRRQSQIRLSSMTLRGIAAKFWTVNTRIIRMMFTMVSMTETTFRAILSLLDHIEWFTKLTTNTDRCLKESGREQGFHLDCLLALYQWELLMVAKYRLCSMFLLVYQPSWVLPMVHFILPIPFWKSTIWLPTPSCKKSRRQWLRLSRLNRNKLLQVLLR